jgi:hypothetical protein
MMNVILGNLMEEPGGGFPVEGFAIPSKIRDLASDLSHFEGRAVSKANA